MRIHLQITFTALALCLISGAAFAKPPARSAKGDEAAEIAENQRKKQAGAACQDSSECRRHHKCKQVGEKKVCVAPEPHEIPPT